MTANEFKTTFMPYYAKLYHIACFLLKNEQDAEDAVQDAYMKLWNKRTELNNIAQMEAYCITLIKNICMDRLRNEQRHIQETTGNNTEDEDNSYSIEKKLQESDETEHLMILISTLPENQQKILRLHDISNFSYEEIEELTGINEANIRVILSRARKKIKDLFNKYTRRI